ncbi:hypothetical protein SPBR_03513 [Sporothrix brasiliensis 5110]|uniref:Uncharacterized protein n=1 Tax=Sporothrix brasiliensis 5110 TaxID=1398154 RepID=A0A0C2J7Q5_9PEZI|nr:uncharacterized protein SPBR_03513 [Sporothrix brasiliensis 5110]KIH95025.1 hypothetical protein SPBR_03513 [Sporothrix brasiliensis 5110]
MSSHTKTLRDCLVRHKPYIPCTSQTLGNTKSANWPGFTVSLWKEFNIRTLNESYGHILDTALPPHIIDNVPSTEQLQGLTVIDDSGPFNIIGWNDKTVLPLVKYAKQAMALHVGAAVHHKHTSSDNSTVAKLATASKRTTIDHIIELGNYRRDVLVVGLGRTSVKWRGSTLIKDPASANNEQEWPVRQLANLCSKAGTRYGYIQTDQELVACCFGATPPSKSAEAWSDWTARVMPVPWNTELDELGEMSNGPRAGLNSYLTTELALWWLCMLSLSDGHRQLVKNDEIVPIDTWDTLGLIDGSVWAHQHRYSAFVKPTADPTIQAAVTVGGIAGGESMPTPSLGNVNVDVRLQTDFWFHYNNGN